jgi:uncharacterized protein with HEPN domain
MRPEEFYLRDILLACKSSTSFVSEISRDFFDSSDLHQSAVLFKLMVIGEAASHISHRIRQQYSEIDWQSLKGFRNIIAHEYFALNQDIVWDSASNDAVVLKEQVEHILKSEYPEFPLPE